MSGAAAGLAPPVDLVRVRAALARLRAAAAALNATQRDRVAAWFETWDGAPTMSDPKTPTVTLTVRLAHEDLAELEALAAELARILPASRMARVNRSTVAAEALRAGLVVLRREHGLPARGAPPTDPRQTRIPGA